MSFDEGINPMLAYPFIIIVLHQKIGLLGLTTVTTYTTLFSRNRPQKFPWLAVTRERCKTIRNSSTVMELESLDCEVPRNCLATGCVS